VAKAADVVGLHVDPPAKAIILCVNEKPSIQALARAQGYLKLPNGHALTGQSHDHIRRDARPYWIVVFAPSVGLRRPVAPLRSWTESGLRCRRLRNRRPGGTYG
jgi:hypothetical protein